MCQLYWKAKLPSEKWYIILWSWYCPRNERYICFESNRFMGHIRDFVILKFNTWIRQKKYNYGLTISRKMSDKNKVKFAPCFVCPQIRYSWLYLKVLNRSFLLSYEPKILYKKLIFNMRINELTFRYTLLHDNIYQKNTLLEIIRFL